MMSYESWRITYQSSEAAAKSAYDQCCLAQDEADKLRADVESLRKDAERYKNLKSVIITQPCGQYSFSTYMGWHPDTFMNGFNEAIDRAMEE